MELSVAEVEAVGLAAVCGTPIPPHAKLGVEWAISAARAAAAALEAAEERPDAQAWAEAPVSGCLWWAQDHPSRAISSTWVSVEKAAAVEPEVTVVWVARVVAVDPIRRWPGVQAKAVPEDAVVTVERVPVARAGVAEACLAWLATWGRWRQSINYKIVSLRRP
jgi:hypothetical protein